MQIKEEGLNIHMCLCRESFGVNTAYGVYLEEENALFESHAIYLHTYRQKGKGQIILDVKGHISIPVIQHMQRQEYFLFLYRCFIMQRQYDWFCLSDKVQAAVECLLPFIRENHMTCYGLLGEQGGAVEAPNILYNRFSGCMFTMFHKEKMGWTWKQDWLLGGGLNLWGIQDDVLKIFVLHMQSEEESIQRMILFGNIMKDIFSEEGEALFQNRIVNPNPPDIWHGWEEIKKVKANFVSLSPLYQMPGELLETMNMGNEKTGIEYQFMYVSVSEKDTELLERSVFKCLDMYLLMRYGGLLQLADLIQDDRVENEQIFPELQKICIEGILEPKDWKIIEKEIFEYKKQLVLSEIEEVIFEIYVNSFHRIQDGVTLEEMLGFLLTFLAEEKRELLRERCEKNGAYKK